MPDPEAGSPIAEPTKTVMGGRRVQQHLGANLIRPNR